MNSRMQIANLLADQVDNLIDFVKVQEKKKSLLLNQDKWYQVRLFVEEFRFPLVADELHRINTFSWNESYTILLVNDILNGTAVMEEFAERNYDDLFLLTAKLFTIKELCRLLKQSAIAGYSHENL